MFLATIPPSDSNVLEVKLPNEGLKVVDSRVIYPEREEDWKFVFAIEGKTLIVTRTDCQNEDDGEYDYEGWPKRFYIRIYNPAIEKVPDPASLTYLYHGLENESAPLDVVEVIVDPSVKVIKQQAFQCCAQMKKCTMGESVERIEKRAFWGCTAMKDIRLSRRLRVIGEWAFGRCHSIDNLFLPFTVESIGRQAFHCRKMRLLVLPPLIDPSRVGHDVIWGCEDLLLRCIRDLKNQEYLDSERGGGQRKKPHRQVSHWLKHRYDHLPLLKLCMDPSVTCHMIHALLQKYGNASAYQRENHHGMTPLHVLVLNPHSDLVAIMACFHANPGASFTPDDDGCTPLESLWKGDNMKEITNIITQLSINRN